MTDYPENWHQIALTIKHAAGWLCEHCGHPHQFPGRLLTVHHINGDKANCEDNNLVALCQACHLHWQHRFSPGQLIMAFALPDWMTKRGHGKH
jgi:hypothetical protein